MEKKLPEPLPLKDAGLLIAGGTAGVGLATALKFAEAGVSRIALMGRDAARGKKARETVATRYPKALVEFIQADAIDPAQATAAAASAERLLGSVDILVNSTQSMTVPALFHNTPIEEILPIIVAQMLAPLQMCSAVLPGMRARQRGVIVSVASDAAKVPTPGEAIIGGAMAGISRFSTTLAVEAKRSGIRVHVVTPSLIGGTAAHDRMLSDPFAGKLFQKALTSAHLGITMPEDIAPLIVFLASPDAARITGQVVSVNGGISVT